MILSPSSDLLRPGITLPHGAALCEVEVVPDRAPANQAQLAQENSTGKQDYLMLEWVATS